jgi:hypothetical protein
MDTREVTIKELGDWPLSGGHWRVADISNERAELFLLTCTSEPLERRQTRDPVVIDYLRTAHLELDSA